MLINIIIIIILSFFFSIVAPSPPVGPIEFSNINRTSVTVTWQPPEDDGGAKVKEYILEAKEATRTSWSRVATVSSVSTSYDVEKLKDKQEYVFRVSAVNSIGQSEPLVSDKVQLTSPYGKLPAATQIYFKPLFFIKIGKIYCI